MSGSGSGEGREVWLARWAIVPSLAMTAALALGGCETRDPNKPLSEDEGAALLRDVRAGKTTVSDLTPADRAYLKKKTGK